MKALFFNQHGSTDNLRYGTVADPQIEDNSYIIKVECASINHLDLWILAGWKGLSLEMPHIGGADICGRISAAGRNCKRFKEGEKVVLSPGFLNNEDNWSKQNLDSLSPQYKIFGEHIKGGFAEYIRAPEHTVYKIPEELNCATAAAALLVGTTAYRMLVSRANLQPGECKNKTILIVGAGGGVNSYSIQLASHLGCKVIALSSSEEKLEKAKALGASLLINYIEKPDWHREVLKSTNGQGVDVVVDNVGKETFTKSIKSLSRGGKLVTVGNTSGHEITFDNRLLFTKQIDMLGSTMGSRNDFEKVLELTTSKQITPCIDSIYPMRDGAEAYKKLEEGSQFGKVILENE